MEYYLSFIDINVPELGTITNITQLVKASSKHEAIAAVRMAAINEGWKDENIIDVRVHQTIIGK